MQYELSYMKIFTDHRGQLVEFIQRNDLQEPTEEFGQVYFVTFEGKDIVRGNHYHKLSRECFAIIQGAVEVMLEDVLTGEKVSLKMTAGNGSMQKLTIGPNIAHAFKSITDFALLIDYASRVYNPQDEDKYSRQLI
jgi:dTDP-4-dehydrorhamnose 3,5-epimerase-like enzyme